MFGYKKKVRELEFEMRVLRHAVERLEMKVAELEAKRVPVISDLTAGKDKPMTVNQLVDEWVNGKDGDGK